MGLDPAARGSARAPPRKLLVRGKSFAAAPEAIVVLIALSEEVCFEACCEIDAAGERLRVIGPGLGAETVKTLVGVAIFAFLSSVADGDSLLDICFLIGLLAMVSVDSVEPKNAAAPPASLQTT